MLVLATKPLQKLNGTDRRAGRQTDRQAGRPMCTEAAAPKITKHTTGFWTISMYSLTISNNFLGLSHPILLYLGLSPSTLGYPGLSRCISVYHRLSRTRVQVEARGIKLFLFQNFFAIFFSHERALEELALLKMKIRGNTSITIFNSGKSSP